MILRILGIIALVITAGWLFNYFKKNEGSWDAAKTWTIQEMKAAFCKDFMKNWQRTVFFILLIAVDILALTGFIPWLLLGKPLGGLTLMLHVIMTPVFAILATILALVWAEKHAFNKNSAEFVKACLKRKKEAASLADEFYAKFFFWFTIIFSVIVATMVFSMYPIFGTIGQEKLLDIHRASSVLLYIFVILFTLRFIKLQSGPFEGKN